MTSAKHKLHSALQNGICGVLINNQNVCVREKFTFFSNLQMFPRLGFDQCSYERKPTIAIKDHMYLYLFNLYSIIFSEEFKPASIVLPLLISPARYIRQRGSDWPKELHH